MSGGFKSLFEAQPWLQTGPHIKHVCAGILSLSMRNALSARKFTVAIMDASWVQNSFVGGLWFLACCSGWRVLTCFTQILALAVHLAKTKDGVTDRRLEWSISRYETMPPMDNGEIPTDFDLLHPSTALGALAAAAARLRRFPELNGLLSRRDVTIHRRAVN